MTENGKNLFFSQCRYGSRITTGRERASLFNQLRIQVNLRTRKSALNGSGKSFMVWLQRECEKN